MCNQFMQQFVQRQIAKMLLGGESAEGSVFAAKKYPKKGVRKCTHCNGDNHVVEACFKLHGYPDWHPKGKTTSNNMTENTRYRATYRLYPRTKPNSVGREGMC
ncbi:hypothetical protein QL285_058958 [Trifolium repens]|nr:hypothetical protein QL285_058958 [Trifolium repens]